MISKFWLIRSLVNLKNVRFLQKIQANDLKKVNDLIEKKFYVKSLLKNQFFNHIFVLYSQLNNVKIEQFVNYFEDFNSLVFIKGPIKINGINDNSRVANNKILLQKIESNNLLNQWMNERVSFGDEYLKFLSECPDLPEQIVKDFQELAHISGKLWISLANQTGDYDCEINYYFGFYLMIFYLIDYETRQQKKSSLPSDWNLLTYFDETEFFRFKLKIIDVFNKYLMLFAQKNFNLYWRVINQVLTKSYS